jgi:hypothetical protein
MALSFVVGQFLPAPGHCLSCGSNGVDCIDSGVNRDFYGALLLCVPCFRDGALRILELELFDKTLHDNMIAELEEKLEWRENLEPTIAKLELDLDIALRGARRGFSQRYIVDSSFDEVQSGTKTASDSFNTNRDGSPYDDDQLFFSLEELRDYPINAGQVDNNVRDEGTVRISSSPSHAE